MKPRSFLRDTFSVLASNTFSIGIGLLSGVLLARLLGPEGRGTYAAMLVVPTVLYTLSELGIKQSVIYFIGRGIHPLKDVIGSIIYIFFFASVLSFSGCILIFIFLGYDEKYEWILWVTATLIIPAKLLISYSSGVFLGQEAINKFNRLSWAPPIVNLLGLLLLVYFANLKVWGALLAMLLSQLVLSGYAFFLMSRTTDISFGLNFNLIKEILKAGIVYAVALFFIQLNYKIDILLLEALASQAEVGYYSLGVSLTEQIWLLPTALGIVILSRTANSSDHRQITNSVLLIMKASFILALLMCVVLFFLSPFIIPLIYGEDFVPSVSVIQAILPGILVFIIFKVINSQFAGMGKPEIALKIFIPAVFLNVLLNFLLIPRLGAIGAAIASDISYGASAVAILLTYKRLMNISIKKLLMFDKGELEVIKRLLMKRGKVGRK